MYDLRLQLLSLLVPKFYSWDRLQIHGKSSFALISSLLPNLVTYIILYQLSDWGTSSNCADGGRQWRWTEAWHGCCKYGFIWASRDSCKQPTLVAETVHEILITHKVSSHNVCTLLLVHIHVQGCDIREDPDVDGIPADSDERVEPCVSNPYCTETVH